MNLMKKFYVSNNDNLQIKIFCRTSTKLIFFNNVINYYKPVFYLKCDDQIELNIIMFMYYVIIPYIFNLNKYIGLSLVNYYL